MRTTPDGASLHRRGFLKTCLRVVGASILTVLPVACGLLSGRRSRRGSYPKRNGAFAGTPEPGHTVLVTEAGQGTSAERGCRLNPVGAEIWRLADGEHSLDEIARVISERFGVAYDVAMEDARSFVQLLADHGLASL